MKARLSVLLLAALAVALTGCADNLFTSNLFEDVARPAVPDATAISSMSETDIAKLLNSNTFKEELLLAKNAANLDAFMTRLEAIESASDDPAVDQAVSSLLADLTLEKSGAAPVVENLLSTFIGLMAEPAQGETVDPMVAEAKKIFNSTESDPLGPDELKSSVSALVNLIFTPESGGSPTVESIAAILTGFADAKVYYEDFGNALVLDTGTGEYAPADATLDMGTLATGALVSFMIDAVTITSSTTGVDLAGVDKINVLASMIIDPNTVPADVSSIDFDTTVFDTSPALMHIASASGLTDLINGL